MPLQACIALLLPTGTEKQGSAYRVSCSLYFALVSVRNLLASLQVFLIGKKIGFRNLRLENNSLYIKGMWS